MASVVGSSYVSKELIAILVFFKRYFNMSLLLKRAGFFLWYDRSEIK